MEMEIFERIAASDVDVKNEFELLLRGETVTNDAQDPRFTLGEKVTADSQYLHFTSTRKKSSSPDSSTRKRLSSSGNSNSRLELSPDVLEEELQQMMLIVAELEHPVDSLHQADEQLAKSKVKP